MDVARIKWLCVPVASLLLLAQVVPTLWRMDCLMSGRSLLSWGQARLCIPYEAPGKNTELDFSCCNFSNVSADRQEFTPAHASSEFLPHLELVSHGSRLVIPWPEPLKVAVRSIDSPPDTGLTFLPVRYRQLLI